MTCWAVWLAGGLACGLAGAEPTGADQAAYAAARDRVGHDAAAQVRLALWCEAHGLPAERLRHLALAVLHDPRNAAARGLMGLVAYGGQWKRPEAVAAAIRSDEALTARLAEYNTRRAVTAETAEAQSRLAAWCEQNGLDAEARAHYSAVVRLDPRREAAWRKLGCKKVGNRWVTESQLAAERAEADAQAQADRRWKPLLTKWRGQLKEKLHHDEAEATLAQVTDPRAVPMIWSVFGARDAAGQAVALTLLTRIDAPGASRALAALAVYGTDPQTRRVAAEVLRQRDPRDYAPTMVGWLRDRIRYEVKDVGGANAPGVLFIKGETANLQRVYTPEALPPILPGDVLTTDQLGLPVIDRVLGYRVATEEHDVPNSTDKEGFRKVEHTTKLMTERERIPLGEMIMDVARSTQIAETQLRDDVAWIDDYNRPITTTNDRVRGLLAQVAGHDFGEDRNA